VYFIATLENIVSRLSRFVHVQTTAKTGPTSASVADGITLSNLFSLFDIADDEDAADEETASESKGALPASQSTVPRYEPKIDPQAEAMLYFRCYRQDVEDIAAYVTELWVEHLHGGDDALGLSTVTLLTDTATVLTIDLNNELDRRFGYLFADKGKDWNPPGSRSWFQIGTTMTAFHAADDKLYPRPVLHINHRLQDFRGAIDRRLPENDRFLIQFMNELLVEYVMWERRRGERRLLY
jgi:hypothetical protein